MHIAMVDLGYPYGKQRVYLNGSLMAAAARLVALGHHVRIVDLNIDEEMSLEAQYEFKQADAIGISVYGSPYIPSAIAFAKRYAHMIVPVLIGGQAVEQLSPIQFGTLFHNTNAVQIANDVDLARALNCSIDDLPAPNAVSQAAAMKCASDHYLERYFSSEMTLVLGQGCIYQCNFCAARKDVQESHVTIAMFEDDLRWMCEKARELGKYQLEFYASSLDLFQNPREIAKYLSTIARVSEEKEMHIRVRGLCCMRSFLRARRMIEDFDALVRDAGIWSLGFGVDGADHAVWKAQGKMHNNAHEVLECLDVCTRLGIRPEVLLVMGFPEDTPRSLLKIFLSAARYVHRWPKVMLRPYLAKSFVPGNEGWKLHADRVHQVLEHPDLFYNLDFSAVASPITHPNWRHRFASNVTYLGIIAVFTPFGNCDTPPLLPQGERGLYGRLARVFNRFIPADR